MLFEDRMARCTIGSGDADMVEFHASSPAGSAKELGLKMRRWGSTTSAA